MSRLLASLVLMFLLTSVAIRAQDMESDGIPILVYHRFDAAKPGATTITTAALESQLAWLALHHYTVIPVATVIETVTGLRQKTPNTIAITVDDGHASVFTILFAMVLKYHIPITLFIYPSAISNAPYALTWEQLRQMKASGLVDIQAHTYWHPDFRREKRRLPPMEYEKFVDAQLHRSKAVLEQHLGSPVTSMAWPYGIYDRDLEQAASRAGYSSAFAYAGGVARKGSDLLAIPRIPVAEHTQGDAFAALLKGAQANRNGNAPNHN